MLGDGATAGLPLALLLRALGAASVNLVSHASIRRMLHGDAASRERIQGAARSAELVFTAVGAPGYLNADFVAPGAVVVDIGIRVDGTCVRGDVHPSLLAPGSPAGAVSPVPGGVGPLTVAALVDNVVAAWERDAR